MKFISVIVGLLMFSGCAGKHVTVREDNKLSLDGCYPLPNCVSSETWVLYNRTAPFELAIPREEAWPMIEKAILSMPRTEIVEYNEVYIHAKFRSRVFGFVDHLELLLDPDRDRISVRSSSLIAIFDFGVNRLRIHNLRKQLAGLNIIRE